MRLLIRERVFVSNSPTCICELVTLEIPKLVVTFDIIARCVCIVVGHKNVYTRIQRVITQIVCWESQTYDCCFFCFFFLRKRRKDFSWVCRCIQKYRRLHFRNNCCKLCYYIPVSNFSCGSVGVFHKGNGLRVQRHQALRYPLIHTLRRHAPPLWVVLFHEILFWNLCRPCKGEVLHLILIN